VIKLGVELVPRTSWCSNVRSEVPRSKWDKIRKKCYEAAGHKCEVCGGVGRKHSVECHEIWEYNDETHEQTLTGLIALCPSCHQVKHAGLAQVRGLIENVISHMVKVNGISRIHVGQILIQAFDEYHRRSQYEWTVDISYIEDYLKG